MLLAVQSLVILQSHERFINACFLSKNSVAYEASHCRNRMADVTGYCCLAIFQRRAGAASISCDRVMSVSSAEAGSAVG